MHTSLNQTLLGALARGVGFSEVQIRIRDLSDLSATWKEDPHFDRAITEQESIDLEP